VNDEELAALADKLIEQGLSDDEIVAHLSRAKIGSAPQEDATSPIEAGAMHAFDALTGYSTAPRGGWSLGGSAELESPEERAQQQTIAEDRQAALAVAGQEHPIASMVGRYGTLALPIVGMGPRGLMATGKGLAQGGGRVLSAGKAMLGETPIIGRRGMVGRPVRAGIKAWQKSAPNATPQPTVAPRGHGHGQTTPAFEIPPQGSFPPIGEAGGGRSTLGLSAGEARAANAPAAYAREHVGRPSTATGTRESARVAGIENPVRAAPTPSGMETTQGTLSTAPAPNVVKTPAVTQSPGPKGTPIRQPRRPSKPRTTSKIAADEVPTQAPATATGLEVGKTAEEAASVGDRGLTQGPFKKGPGHNPVPKVLDEAASANRAKRYAGIGTGPNTEQSLAPKTQTMPSGPTSMRTLVPKPPIRPYPKTPEEFASAAKAKATIAEQIAQGWRGPGGGMRSTNKAGIHPSWTPLTSGPPNVYQLDQYPVEFLQRYAATGRNKNIAKAIQEFLASGGR